MAEEEGGEVWSGVKFMIEKRKLQRLTFCACGLPTLNESIKLGTVYEIDTMTIRGGYKFYCGGCKTWYPNIVVVQASQILHPDRGMMPLPYILFTEAD